jgi:hypothetical protein
VDLASDSCFALVDVAGPEHALRSLPIVGEDRRSVISRSLYCIPCFNSYTAQNKNGGWCGAVSTSSTYTVVQGEDRDADFAF